MSDKSDTSRKKTPRVASSAPMMVEISNLEFDDVVHPHHDDGNAGKGRTVKHDGPSSATGVHDVSDVMHRSYDALAPSEAELRREELSLRHDELLQVKDMMAADKAMRVHDGDSLTVGVNGFRAGNALGWSFFISLMYGIVLFLFLSVVMLGVDSIGLIDAVNTLMGEAMHFSLRKMILYSGLLSVVFVVFLTVLKWLKMMAVNAFAAWLNPLKFKVNVLEVKRNAPVGEKTAANTGKDK